MNQLERKESAGTLNQQLTRSTRAGSVMMTSAVMSSQSEGSYSRTSRWMIQTQEIKRRRTGRSIQSQATVHQQMIFEDSDSKTMSFGLMDTTAFCLRAKDSADGLCVGNNQQIATVVLNQLLQDSSRSVSGALAFKCSRTRAYVIKDKESGVAVFVNLSYASVSVLKLAGTLNQQLTRSARAGSVMMTSAVMSSQSKGSYSRTSRWMIQTQEIKRRRTGRSIQSQATVHQQMIFEDSDSKTMSFGLMDTTAFCLRAKDSADGLCVGNNQQIATVVLNQQLQDSSRSVVVLEKESVDGITHMLKPAGAFIQMCSSRRIANDEGRAGYKKGFQDISLCKHSVVDQQLNTKKRSS
ncbi:hypothetical protein F511_16283 [Dorcoceras hygrometricum]|uniref:Uncharacterized protein n=1 Tax=Dorcoceras hygrometricum TaxID=472368 RepID=A0A2Z7BBA7_9LAMI|nr:hypothetical protein F511_16283 [Dorcoceras hygrometricum]